VTESTRDAGKNRVISRDDDDTAQQIADLFSVPPHHRLSAIRV